MKLGFSSILTLIFVLSKIFGFIDWSWLLVFSPTIFVFSLYVIFFLFVLIIGLFTTR